MKFFNIKKALLFLSLVGIIGIGLYSEYNKKEESRSAKTIVDIRSGEVIFSTSSNNKNKIIKPEIISRGAITTVNIETGEIISINRYAY